MLPVNHIRSFPDSTHTVQERCEFTLDRRLLPGDDPNEAFAEIEHIAKEVERIEDPVSGKSYGVEVRLGPFMYPSLVRTATGWNAASPGVAWRHRFLDKTLVRSGVYRHLNVTWCNPAPTGVICRGATTALPRMARHPATDTRYHACEKPWQRKTSKFTHFWQASRRADRRDGGLSDRRPRRRPQRKHQARSVTAPSGREPSAGLGEDDGSGAGRGAAVMKRALSDRLLRSLARPRATPQEIWA